MELNTFRNNSSLKTVHETPPVVLHEIKPREGASASAQNPNPHKESPVWKQKVASVSDIPGRDIKQASSRLDLQKKTIN